MSTLNINAPEGSLRASYANMVHVTHTAEEFVLDFISAFEPRGELVSRLVVSPAHLKRVIRVLQEQFEGYEREFGPLHEAGEPKLLPPGGIPRTT